MNHESDNSKAAEDFVREFSKHSVRLRAYIIAIVVDSNDADEVFQNTSCILWQKFSSFDPSTNFMAWACRIAYLEFANFRRSKGRRPILNDDVIQLAAAEAEAKLDQWELRYESLQSCLEELPERERDLLSLRYFEERGVQDIATKLSTSIHTVYRRLNRIYSLLLGCIERRVATKETM